MKKKKKKNKILQRNNSSRHILCMCNSEKAEHHNTNTTTAAANRIGITMICARPRPKRPLMVSSVMSVQSGIGETLEKVSVSTTFAQSWTVSVSTPFEFLGLEESWYCQLSKDSVSKSLGLDIFCFLSLADSLSINYMESVLSCL